MKSKYFHSKCKVTQFKKYQAFYLHSLRFAGPAVSVAVGGHVSLGAHEEGKVPEDTLGTVQASYKLQ